MRARGRGDVEGEVYHGFVTHVVADIVLHQIRAQSESYARHEVMCMLTASPL